MSNPSVDRVLAAAVEGQAQSLRFIQQQLSELHAALEKAGTEIRASIQIESKHTAAEVEIQYALTLESVAAFFSDSDFDKALLEEYKMARGENSPSNLTPYGVVYLVPSRFNLVYSCVTAVAAAIAAGNCIILELPKTLSRTSEILQRVLTGALSRDTFMAVEKPLESALLPKGNVRLFGSHDPAVTPSRFNLVPPGTRSIAIVDRYADMHEAATAILRARFSFAGQSPFAPDIVLVNEFRIKEFCNAIAEKTSKYFAEQVEMNGSVPGYHTKAAKARASRISSHELDQAGAETVISGSKGTVALIKDRKSTLLRKPINEPLIIIHPVRSIDDALDFANSDNDNDSNEPLSAIFAFGCPDVAKYVCQFVNAHLCCANNIPVELLVRPMTPIGFATRLSVSGPYTKEMLSMPKPQYIQFEDKAERLCRILEVNDVKDAIKVRQAAQALDTRVQQPAGHAIGFFEQGLFLGASVLLSSLVTGGVLLWKYGVPVIVRRVRR